MPASSPAAVAAYDRVAELRALDATFSGVQGLVASGVTHIPRIFQVTDPEPQPNDPARYPGQEMSPSIPVIDLGGGDHEAVVAAVRRAAVEWGFFLLTGHGVPEEVVAAAEEEARVFHEADGGEGSEKARLYSRDAAQAVKYNCNFDLYRSKVANWRDTLQIRVAPDLPAPDEMPQNCRPDAFLDYAKHMNNLLETLFGLLSEALGLKPSYLTDIGCNQGRMIACHYYPPCPQPELAIGTTRHSDSGFLTVLLQDETGGLQFLHDGRWIDVAPTPGAFIVNIADLLQIISNDRFKSAEHRVLAKNARARVSIACFTSDTSSTRMYGPIKELLSDENPPLYRETLVRDYLAHYYAVGLGPKTATNDFRK